MYWCSAVSNSPSLELAIEDVTKEIIKKSKFCKRKSWVFILTVFHTVISSIHNF